MKQNKRILKPGMEERRATYYTTMSHEGGHRGKMSGSDVARGLDGLGGARITSSHVDLGDILTLVLH
jgi:hypothetical protein